MADSRQTTWRTDEQLLAIVDEPSEWTINGLRGKVLSSAGSLRDALLEARRLRVRITAVVRLTGEPVIVFYGQIDRISALIDAGA
jgi:hypothetical protein